MMNHYLPLLSHGLHGMWSRAGSPHAGRLPRGISLCLLLLTLLVFHPQKASALKWSDTLGWTETGVYTRISAWEEVNWKAEKYLKFTHRNISASEPYLEFEMEFHYNETSMTYCTIALENGNDDDIKLLFTNRWYEYEKNQKYWQARNGEYGTVVWTSAEKKGCNGNSDAWVATFRYYPTKKYYELADRALYICRGFDSGNDGGSEKWSDYDNSMKCNVDVMYRHSLHPLFDDGLNEPTVTRTAPGTIKVEATRGNSTGNYTYSVTAGNTSGAIAMNSGSTSGSTTLSTNDGALNNAFTLTYSGYTVRNISLPNDILKRNFGSVEACSAYQGDVTISSNNYNTYTTSTKSMNVSASTKAKDISSLNWKKCEKQVIVNWNVTTGVGTNGSWGIYRSVVASNGSYSNRTLLGTVWYNTRTYTDESVQYDKTYHYEVAYLPNGTTNAGSYSSAQLANLSATKDQTTTRSYKFNEFKANLNSDKSKLVLSWNIENETTKPKIYIDYRVGKNGTWTQIGNGYDFAATNSITPNISYASCESYYFRMRITSQNMEFSQEATGDNAIGTKTTVTDLTASKGSYAGMVRLTWDAKVADKVTPVKYVVSRRIIGTDAWGVINTVSGTATSYSYEDNTALPGEYYEYKVECYGNNCDENNISVSSQQMRYGFAQSTGTLTGRITYAGGTAVPDATVRLVPTSEDVSKQQFYSTHIDSAGYVNISLTEADARRLFVGKKFFSVQFWCKFDPIAQAKNNRGIVFDVYNIATLDGTKKSSGKYELRVHCCTKTASTNKYLEPDHWYHLNYVRTDSTVTVYVIDPSATKESDRVYVVPYANTNEGVYDDNIKDLVFGHSNTGGAATIDEIRLWSRALSRDEILANYDHPLVGTELGLECYLPLDEGIGNLKDAFDISKTGGVANEHHATYVGDATMSTEVPDEDIFSLYAKSDEDGNYVLRGVPFSGSGTNYNVIPAKGSHKFSPTKQSRYVSANSLNFSGVDFNDISSFKVRGEVYYEGTDIPVDSVQFYVDGNICAKNGTPIMTGVDGKYEIDVPIGDHYITAARLNHTFANGGRYPADPNNTELKATFVEDAYGVNFYDNSMAVLTGRVVGGAVERDKQIGFGLSKNNIGQARITLQTTDQKHHVNVKTKGAGATTNGYDMATETVQLQSPTELVKSSAWRNADNGDATAARQIVIETDPATGEYAVLLPPLRYEVVNVEFVKNNPDVTFDFSSSKDEVNVMMLGKEKTDTLKTDKSKTFTYLTRYDKIYTAPTHFSVTQDGRDDGSFGLASVSYKDAAQVEHTVDNIYTISANGNVSYTYSAPIFQQGDEYTFNIEAYQSYKNYEGAKTVEDIVPMAGLEVTASNGLSEEQYVAFKENVVYNGETYQPGDLVEMQTSNFTLDDEGKATYVWRAGFPDLTSPYNHRGFNFTYGYESWRDNPQQGIILGCVPTGSNFTTAAPDVVEMVLRDPPGTGSSATWETGTTVTTSHTDFQKSVTDDKIYSHVQAGFWQETEAGVGVVVVTRVEAKVDADAGVHSQSELGDENTIVTTTTLDRSISTSAEAEYVGAPGDVFIGRAKNYKFGAARTIGFMKDGNNYVLHKDDGIVRSTEYGTHFNYTQFYVENTLMPNLEKLRNALLIYNENPQSVTPQEGKILFVTKLKPGDYGYGSSNDDKEVWGDLAVGPGDTTGPSYAMILKRDASGNALVEGCDSIKLYNNNIAGWEATLAANEEAKVKAKNNRSTYFDQNISFDSGSSITQSQTQTKSVGVTTTKDYTTTAILNASIGGLVCEVGMIMNTENEWGRHKGESDGTENEEHSTVSYSLVEVGDDDAISVDVFKSPDGFSPIFSTQAGQTCCPYEGARYTKYYKPGTKLDEATMQIEQPHILVDRVKNAVKTGVANGTTARFDVLLTNTSEIDEDVIFDVFVPTTDNNNLHGAKVALNTKNISLSKVSVLVPANDSVKTVLTIDQNDLSVQKYDSIAVVIASQCQQDPTSTWEVIADTAYVTVHFVPSSSPVTMRIPATTVNTTNPDESLAISVNGYNLDFNGFKGVKLQYKYANDAAWTTFKEYHASSTYATPTSEQLPEGGLTYDYNMKGKSDGKYTFRAMSTATYDSKEYYVYSDETVVIKDMQRPQLLGYASPSDGILSAGEEISVNFNEDIRSGAINELTSFDVIGALNEAQIDHNVGLKMEGTDRAAYTEADINLGNRSFSVETWVNIAGEGTLFAHGRGGNNFTLGADADGYLVANINGNTYTSAKAMPFNKWNYLMVSYNYEEGASTLTAHVATSDETIKLFTATPVADYNSSGGISLGSQMNGAIHELTIWDNAHTLAEAQQYMNITKKPTEPGLIGYWKFDEGNGTTATDVARSRNMTLTAPNWYLNNKNKAVTLDGSKALQMDITAISSGDNDDYAFEMWFKGSDTNKGATLFATSVTDGPKMTFDADGMLTLTSKGTATQLSKNNYLDNAWHHVALNVLRGGSASVYVDGSAVKQLSAKTVAALQGYALFIGADKLQDGSFDGYFTGGIDEVRLWHATLNGKTIQSRYHSRLQGDEDGLVAYYPFEAKTLDSGNQVIVVNSPLDNALDANGRPSTLNMTSTDAADIAYSDEAPALKPAKSATNLDFSYVASERKIVFKLNNAPDLLEGTTVQFTVKNVADMNGNNCLPIVWTAYIRQNQLLWLTDNASVKGEQGSDMSFTAQFENTSGQDASWTLAGLPVWLNAEETSGTLAATKQKTLKFTVDPSTAIGKYETTIYLYGNNQIYEPLTVSLNVTGDLPDWKVNPSSYEYTMNIVGKLNINGKMSDDTEDIVAAFDGTQCVGLASPTYFKEYDAYYVMMTAYMNEENRPITFKVYDASTGIIYPSVETSVNVKTEKDVIIGSIDDPIVWTPDNKIEQNVALATGWNWISFYVNPSDKTIASVFKNVNVAQVKTSGDYAQYAGGNWSGDLSEIGMTSMYKLKANEDGLLQVIGMPVVSKDTPITIRKGWNWLGAATTAALSPAQAFGGLEPANGDVVKSQRDFSVYTNNRWVGSLETIVPGVGYLYSSEATTEKTFTYPTVSTQGRQNAPRRASVTTNGSDIELLESNMNVIVTVVDENGLQRNDAVIRVSAYGQLRGEALAPSYDSEYFLTVQGKADDTEMQLSVQLDGVTYNVGTIFYQQDALYGSVNEPVVLVIGETTAIRPAFAANQSDNGHVYDLGGRRVSSEKLSNRQLNKGIYILDHQKVVK